MDEKTEATERKVGILLGIGIFLLPIVFAWFTLRKGHSTISRAVSFIWLAFVMVIAFGSSNSDLSTSDGFSSEKTGETEKAADAENAQPQIDDATIITARELAGAYESNEVAAKQQFGDRPLLVTGRVTAITLDFLDNPVVQMEGSNQFLDVQAKFDKDDSDQIAQISQGNIITVRCEEITEVIGAPMLDECQIE